MGPVSLQKQAEVHCGEATRCRSPWRGDTSELHAGQLVVFSAPGVFPAGLGNRRSERTPRWVQVSPVRIFTSSCR